MNDLEPINEEEIQMIYNWIDQIPLSRSKKNISRDFSDGLLIAEVVRHFIPKIVDLHNYPSANSVAQKANNWKILNFKIFKKLGFQVSKSDVEKIINSVPEIIERVLLLLKNHIQLYLQKPNSLEEKIIPTTNAKKFKGAFNNEIPNTMTPLRDESEELKEKDKIINELKETIEILELKIKKMEQLIKLKDSKIKTMANKLAQVNLE